jgi:hypothetical protein
LELTNVTYQGPPPDDLDILRLLPQVLRNLLAQINGFIQFGGALHIRGASVEPAWHSLRNAWLGELALSKLYPEVSGDDIPFGQDAFGDQFLLRNSVVHRLNGETGDLDSLDESLNAFLHAAQRDPIGYLNLGPLIQFFNEGGTVEPGQLLSVYPPFCTKEAAQGVSLRAVPAAERIAFLADLAAQLAELPEGSEVRFEVSD